MKIVHICISNPYIDGWGYQENLLPEYMARRGDDVYVIATYNGLPKYLNDEIKEIICQKGKLYSLNGISIHRINVIPISESVVIPFGLAATIKLIDPDIIFHHNVNPFSLFAAVRAKRNSCHLFVDNHADEFNCSKKRLFKILYYRIFVRFCCCFVSKYVTKYFGVTYSRCSFLYDYFGIDRKKIDFLPIGADSKLAETIEPKSLLRIKYGFMENDAVVVSGGKMGIDKGTYSLIDAVLTLNTKGLNVKLVLFGKFEDEQTEMYANASECVHFYGWCDRRKTLELLKIGDVACWPIHHTTLCEDAVAVGTPLILRKTGTTCHLIDGNGLWIENSDIGCALNKFFHVDRRSFVLKCESMQTRISYESIVNRIYDFME